MSTLFTGWERNKAITHQPHTSIFPNYIQFHKYCNVAQNWPDTHEVLNWSFHKKFSWKNLTFFAHMGPEMGAPPFCFWLNQWQVHIIQLFVWWWLFDELRFKINSIIIAVPYQYQLLLFRMSHLVCNPVPYSLASFPSIQPFQIW
jgi:hypothetical protein